MAELPPPVPPPPACVEAVTDESKWAKLRSVPFCAQLAYFANTNWLTLTADDKLTLAALLAKMYEQHDKHGAKEHEVSYPQFCKLLQQLEDTDKRVEAVLKAHGDRTSMSKRFRALGFKLRGDATLIEALLFIFGITTAKLTFADPTPMAAALRLRIEEQTAEENKMAALKAVVDAAIADEKKAQDEHKPMQATRARTEKVKATAAMRDYEMIHRKALKAAKRAVAAAEAALAAEKLEGTAADAWLHGVCEAKHIPYTGW